MKIQKNENIPKDRWINAVIQQYVDRDWYVLHTDGSLTAKTDFSIRIKVKTRLI